MKQFSVAVNKIEDGILHVRSAGLIMKEASQFASDVKVTKDEKTVNGKDILEWMRLKLAVGDVITVNIEGPDEEAAADSFHNFINKMPAVHHELLFLLHRSVRRILFCTLAHCFYML